MNRLALFTEQKLADPYHLSLNSFASTPTATAPPTTREDSAPYASFAPIHYESGYAYPLVIWLHSAEGDERQLPKVMPLVSMRNYVAAAPRGPCIGHGSRETPSWTQSAAKIADAEENVFHCIEAMQARFHINPRRIFVVGFGSGGTMAVRIAWNHPQRFAGVASIGGPLPRGHRPLRNVNDLRKLPLLLSTGRQSRSYDEQHVCRDLQLLHTAGLTVALRQYPCGDDLRTTMLSDLDRWMMAIVCGASEPAGV